MTELKRLLKYHNVPTNHMRSICRGDLGSDQGTRISTTVCGPYTYI